MLSTVSEIKINNTLPEVYSVASKYPEFVSFFFKKKIIFSNDEKILVELGMKKMGILFLWSGEGTKYLNTKINFIQTNGLFKGLEAVWSFAVSDNEKEKTIVKIKTSFKFKSALEDILFRLPSSFLLIEPTTNKILIDLKRECERC